MTRIAGEVTIDAPIAEVSDTVADERNEPRYNPRVLFAPLLTLVGPSRERRNCVDLKRYLESARR